MKAVGYTCLNTMSQQPKNFTLAVQEKVVRNYIKSQGWEQGKIYREVISTGDSQGQPTLDQIIADSGSGKFDLLVVARLDRLTRNIRNRFWKDANKHARRTHWAFDAALAHPPGADRTSLYLTHYEREFNDLPYWAK